MVGNKNLRLLKYILPVAAVCLLLYALYEYRQAATEVDVQTRHLRESQEEYKTLTKRFDMLSHELKNAVQATADLDKQLKLEKKNRIKVESEKAELERQFETEGVRRNNENNKLSKEKQQLAEEKVDLNRQLDRLNARLQTLTQEMTELGETHSANEKKLKGDCDTKLDQQAGKVTSLNRDLADCRSDRGDIRDRLEQCKDEAANAAAKYHRHRQEDRYKRDGYQYSRRDDGMHDDERYRREDYYQPKHGDRRENGGPPRDGEEPYHVAEDGKHLWNQRGGYGRKDDALSHMEGHDSKALDDRGDTHHIGEKKKREIYDSLYRKMANGEELTEKQQRAYKLLHAIYGVKHQGSVKEENNKAQGADSLKAKNLKSETKPTAQGKTGEEAHLKKETEVINNRQQAQAPPSPANDGNNNEQEEVMDLIDGHQKLDSAKDSQKDGGAGEQKPDLGGAMDKDLPKGEDEDANVEGKDPRDDPKDNMQEEEGDNQDQPLQKPVPEGGEKKPKEENGRHQQAPVIDPPEPVGNGHEDDEDADGGDYNKHDREEGEDERNRVNAPANQQHEEGGEDPDGRQAFLRDRQAFEQERVRNLQKEPRKGLAKEKQDQIKDMESELRELNAPKKRLREIR